MDNILRYKNHSAFVSFSADDEVFYGKMLGIKDLVSFEASSVRKLKTAFKEAVEDYVELRQEIENSAQAH